MSGHCAPEKVFLKNNPVISPADMSGCILSRTTAMIEGVIESLNSDGYESEFCPDRQASPHPQGLFPRLSWSSR